MFWKRTLGVWLLGLGLAGLVQTVENWRVVDRSVPGINVYQQRTLEEPLSLEDAQAQFGPTIHDIGAEELAGIDAIEAHLSYFDIDSVQIVLRPDEWQGFCKRLRVHQDSTFVIVYRGILFRLEGLGQTEGNEYGPGVLVDSEYLGRIAGRESEYPFAEMTSTQFAEHADIYENLRVSSEYRGEGPLPGYLPLEVWTVFQNDVIGQRNQFVVAGRLYQAEEVDEVESVRIDLPGLAIAFKIAAGFCLMLGVWFLVKPYRIAAAKEGIHIAGPAFAMFGDAVSLVCTGVCAFMWLDVLLFHGLGQAGGLSTLNQLLFNDDLSLWDPVQRDAIYFAFGFGALMAPALAALVTQRSGQAIRVKADGVTSDGGFRTSYIPWKAVDEVVIESERLPTFRTGLPVTRRLQKKLILRGEDCELTINEPSLGNTKRQIVQLLVEQAPEPVAEKIRNAVRSW